MTEKQKKELVNHRKDTYGLLIELGDSWSDSLLANYSRDLNKIIEFETYSKKTELDYLEREFQSSLQNHKDFILINTDIVIDINIKLLRNFLETGEVFHLYEFLVDFICEPNIQILGNVIKNQDKFTEYSPLVFRALILFYSEYLLKIIAKAYLSRKKLYYLKKRIAVITSSINKIHSNDQTDGSPTFKTEITKDQEEYTFNIFNKLVKDNLFNLLINKGLIASNSSKKNFINIFSNTHLDKTKPINWIGTETLLVYLLNNLNEFISIPSYGKRFLIASKCFYKRIHNDMTNRQLSSSSYNYENTKRGKPKGHHLIDEILKKIKDQ